MQAPLTNGAPEALRRAATPLDRLFHAVDSGYAALLLSGRSLYELVADGDGRLLTLLELFRRHARADYGMLTITYSLANGLDWDAPRLTDGRDRQIVETVLRTHGLLDLPPDEHEVVRVLRGITSLTRTRSDGARWSDGRPLGFAVVLEFAEHLTPRGEGVGRTDQETVTVELCSILGQSNALRQSGNIVVVHGRAGHVDALVTDALHVVHLAQPDPPEKRHFISSAHAVYTAATYEPGLSDDDVVRLTANTPNRGFEERLRASHRLGVPVTIEDLLAQKHRDVLELSEGTLTTLDTRRVQGLRLVGRNVEVPLQLLTSFGECLLHGVAYAPSNVLLVGPPSSGKTDLALYAADRSRTSAYQVHSPKGGIVGETERKARLLTTALSQWTPNVAFIDEITEAMPLERSDFDGDSGASRAVMAALLTALSDESRRGRSLLVATTNRPNAMSAAMRSRFVLIPVFGPVREDFPLLVEAIAERIAPGTALAADDVREAADLFYYKGASPREIRAALGLSLLTAGVLTPEAVLQAARDACPAADRVSAEYADLWALKACTSKRFLPWYRSADRYPFPPHLDGLVDRTTSEIDRDEMERRLEERHRYANV